MTLTDEVIRAIYESHGDNCYAFARAIEARVLEELRKQDLLKGMAEIRQAGYTDIVSDGGLDPRKAAPIPPTPTPSQQEALSEAMRILYKAYRGEAWSMDYQKLLTTQRG